ncbi:MAG: hypothetical protein LE169_00910 [Endomicrobium sp.]|nr:hypothetical protein [Endomicrobium sp.]
MSVSGATVARDMSLATDSLTKIEQILTKIEGKIIKRTARKVALRSPGASLKLISNFIIATRMKN